MKRFETIDYITFTLITTLGFYICYLALDESGAKILWDSENFFDYGIPVMILVCLATGFARPGKSWWWGIGIVILQPIWLIHNDKTGPEIFDELILFGIIALFCMIAAFMGGGFRYVIEKK